MKNLVIVLFTMLCYTSVGQNEEKTIFKHLRVHDGKLELLTKKAENTQLPVPRTTAVVQEIDSMLYWRIDNTINNWKNSPYRRYSQYTYDPNSNCTGFVREELDVSQSKFKEDMAYDANNNLIQSIMYGMYTTTWMPQSKRDYTYNSSNNVLTNISSSWFNNTWNNSNRFSTTYNSAQKRTSYTYENWNNNVWQGTQRWMYSYDANNNQILQTDETYTNNAWVFNSRTTDTYDVNGNKLSETYELYSNPVWTKSHRDLMTYGAANVLLTYTYQTGDPNNQWKNEYRDSYTYDIGNNPAYALEEEWTGTSWENSLQVTFTCVANNITAYILEEWNGSIWVNSEKETFTYNAFNKLLTETYQTWIGTSWVNDSKTVYTYDVNGNITSQMLFEWIGNTWKIRNYATDNFDSNSFNYRSVFKFYSPSGGPIGGGDSTNIYYKTVVGLKENAHKQNVLSIYPNPGKGVFTLETKEDSGKIEVFDLVGKPVFQGKIESLNTKLDLSTLSKGIYIVVFSQGKTRETQRLVIE